MVSKMTGYAPLSEVYAYADRVIAPGTIVRAITRCKYATLARMARSGGDLSFASIPARLKARMSWLAAEGLVKRVCHLGRYELTPLGWRVLNESEAAWKLDQEKKEHTSC